MNRYIIASGGTGGHINPAIEVARALKNEGEEIVFIGSSNRMEEKLISREEFDLITLDISYKRNLLSIYKMIRAIIKVIRIIKLKKIDRIIGFGSYISLPTLIAALIMRKEIYLHEQNLKMGLTNKIFEKFAKRVFLSFPANKSKDNYILTGNAIRDEFYELDREKERKKLNIGDEDRVLLIIGGSQGSKYINETILENIERFLIKNIKIFWIAGNEEFLTKLSKYNNIRSFTYSVDLPSIMISSDLIISRAGATTLYEIIVSKTPAILIPYISLKVGQLENAEYLRSITNIDYFEESDVEGIINIYLDLINDQEKLNSIRDSLDKIQMERAKSIILKELL